MDGGQRRMGAGGPQRQQGNGQGCSAGFRPVSSGWGQHPFHPEEPWCTGHQGEAPGALVSGQLARASFSLGGASAGGLFSHFLLSLLSPSPLPPADGPG